MPERGWELIRQAAYVCMTPASWASTEVLEMRKEAFVNNVSTSHWPHKFAMAMAGLPDQPLNDPTQISKEQRALIGYSREGYNCIGKSKGIGDKDNGKCSVL
mmetsp:Transcript_147714/g.269362  ORF Transcript_147714/g.269362 Transcript_147714/m.269362 type:complete len:102 (-) Transcript_147714:31-336(-)